MMYQCNGRKMNEGINLFYSILKKTKLLIFSSHTQGSSGSGDKQQRVMPEIVGSNPHCARTYFFFTQFIAGKFRKC
jgi:hypothetical protein